MNMTMILVSKKNHVRVTLAGVRVFAMPQYLLYPAHIKICGQSNAYDDAFMYRRTDCAVCSLGGKTPECSIHTADYIILTL